MGTKEKFWTSGPDGEQWLFKYARVAADGYVSGEDWAEWLVCQLAALIRVPVADVLPARCDGKRGAISRSILNSVEELVHGNEVLAGSVPGYDTNPTGENPDYRVGTVRDALDSAAPKVPWPHLSQMSAFDVWAGYLTMDAWVNGCDRHDQNWGLVTDGHSESLASSFDHGNALGFQVRPEKHQQMVEDQALFERWVERGCCRYFAGKPKVLALAQDALTLAAPDARGYWLERIAEVDMNLVDALVGQVPSEIMSEGTRMFVVQLLDTNRRRILNGNYNVDPKRIAEP